MASPLAIALAQAAKGLKLARPVQRDISTRDLWLAGDLTYKFWDVQKKMAAVLQATGSLKKVLNCSRRLRKTTTALALCIGELIVNDGPPIRFVAPTQKMLRNIVHPIIKMLCEDAPDEVKPIWKSQDGYYLFPKLGTELHLAGANNGHEDDSRGVASRRCVVDEAQMIDGLKYLVGDVLMPQLLSTRGDLWMLFTPPKSPVHDVTGYAQEAKLAGSYAEYNIHQSQYDQDIIEQFCKEAGGSESTTWKREYLCQFVVDSNFAIIPEWKDEYAEPYVPDEFFTFYHRYAGMDIGVRDLTVILFAVYDFRKAKLYIQDELMFSGPQMTTDKVAEGIKKKEVELWGTVKPKLRISDNNNLILLQDLGMLHGVHFSPTNKDTLEAMVNNLRLWVSSGRIIVDPKCEQLVGCLKYGVWNDDRKDFERSSNYGHFDALAALIYLVRNIDEHTNPIPRNYGLNSVGMWIKDRKEISQTAEVFQRSLLSKRKR